LGVYNVKPGITGLAQINKIDMSTPKELARIDARMINDFGAKKYFHYIIVTVLGKGSGDRIVNK
jgi:O-antigen biosynthesis protein WbqP